MLAVAEKTERRINLTDVLATAETTKKGKGKKEVPAIQANDEIRELASNIRKMYEEMESIKSIYETYQAQLIEAVRGDREKICRAGYQTSIKIPDKEGLSIMLNWKHAYSKILMENEETLKGITGEENYDKFFQTEMEITVKDISEEALTELIECVGVERFSGFFAVARHIAPTRRYTEDYYREFTPEQRQRLEQTVKQYKPALKVR